MTRIACMAVAALLLAPTVLRAEETSPDAALPRVLIRHGFGHADQPVRVTFVAAIAEVRDHPTWLGSGRPAPPNTLWVFQDPTPVWRVLAQAKTRRYADGMFPAAAARFTIDASDDQTRRRIHLHFRAGEGDISVRRTGGTYEGGAWSFAPAADAALVALLSRTPPHAIGASPTKIFQLYRPQPVAHRGPRLFWIDNAQSFEEHKTTLRQRYGRIGDWRLPHDFDWATHFLFGVELPAGKERKRLDWSGARLRDGILAWELSARPEDKDDIPAGSTAVVLGALRRPEGLRHLRADFANGTQAEVRWQAAEDYHTPQPDAVFLRVTEPNHTNELDPTKRTIDVYWDGSYVAVQDAGRHYGRIPMALCVALRKALGVVPYPLDVQGRPPAAHEHVVMPTPAPLEDPEARSIRLLLAYLDRAHAR